MPSYQEIRELAIDLNSRMPEGHPCTKGYGNCCEQGGDIVLTKGDTNLILEALADGRIPDSVKQQTIANLSGPNPNFCPFFNQDQRICSIYEDRPLVCVSYGSAEMPETTYPFQIRTDGDGPVNGQTRLEVRQIKAEHMRVCQDCYNCLAEAGESFSLKDMFDSRKINNYALLNEQKTMRKFVVRDLMGSKEVKEASFEKRPIERLTKWLSHAPLPWLATKVRRRR